MTPPIAATCSARAVIVASGVASACGPSVTDLEAAVSGARSVIGPAMFVAEPERAGAPVAEARWASGATGLRFVELARTALDEALDQVANPREVLDTAVVVVGTGAAPRSAEDWRSAGRQPVGAADGSCDRCELAASAIQERYSLTHPVRVVNTSCASGLSAFVYGAGVVERGHARFAICLGVDEFSFGLHRIFLAMGALSPQGCEPFHRSDGTTFGEGAAAVILEGVPFHEVASRRGLVAVAGVGASTEHHHPTRPDPTGAGLSLAASRAMAAATMLVKEISVVSTHGTGTRANDLSEAAALSSLDLNRPDVTLMATKGTHGHCHGASSLIELVLLQRALSGERSDGAGMKLCAAMGGLNAAVVLERIDGSREPSEHRRLEWRPRQVSELDHVQGGSLPEAARTATAELLAAVGLTGTSDTQIVVGTHHGPAREWASASLARRAGVASAPTRAVRLPYHSIATAVARQLGSSGGCSVLTGHPRSGVWAFEDAVHAVASGAASSAVAIAIDDVTADGEEQTRIDTTVAVCFRTESGLSVLWAATPIADGGADTAASELSTSLARYGHLTDL